MIDIFKNSTHLDMAVKALNFFSKNKKTYQDYNNFISTLPASITESYNDRINILNELLRLNFLKTKQGLFYINKKMINKEDREKLLYGNESLWKLMEASNKKIKFNNEELKKRGLIGEKFLIKLLKKRITEEKHNKIKHISLEDDTAGYDILTPSVIDNENIVALEVKTSKIVSNNFNFYLSRNEYKKGTEYTNWYLVFVELKNELCNLIGHSRLDIISEYIPREYDESVRWESLQIKLNKDFIIKELP